MLRDFLDGDLPWGESWVLRRPRNRDRGAVGRQGHTAEFSNGDITIKLRTELSIFIGFTPFARRG